MPMDIDGKTLFNLLHELVDRRLQEFYRGNENIRILKPFIGTDGMIGFVGSIIKTDPRDGSFRIVEIYLSVLDDLGYPLHNIEDVGGQCVMGEIVKAGHIFRCRDCNRFFCEKHVRFLDRNEEEPLCFVKGKGCFQPYKREIDRIRDLERKRFLIEEETRFAKAVEERFLSMRLAEQAKADYRNSCRGIINRLLGFRSLELP
jgi:hypothetical protein